MIFYCSVEYSAFLLVFHVLQHVLNPRNRSLRVLPLSFTDYRYFHIFDLIFLYVRLFFPRFVVTQRDHMEMAPHDSREFLQVQVIFWFQ